MIKRPEQIRLLSMGLPDKPLNVGGPEAKRNDNTQSSTNTTTNTTTNVIDRRFVNDGGGAGVAGDNNVTYNSVSSTDLGAIAGAMDLGKTSLQLGHDDMNAAVGLAGQTFQQAVTSNEDMFKLNAGNMMDGFSKLMAASQSVMDTAKAVNQTATADVQQAYQSAQEMSSGSKFLVAGGLVIAGIVALQRK
ncbi:hypothetical protein [Paraburkholderia hospita]|uniref:hypothetical protein n=1 Tax=Paraburkholderia hospita TaxID=169430 RepID=UPI0009A5F22E|nr:hypothetical protein [Paraburkholderia hospita]SKC92259.1 hypothetical protein SAMN05446934_6036 [Paraburkholderia hospita]